MKYCSNGSFLSDPWTDDGLSRCFTETLTSSIVGGFVLFAGVAQILVYKKFSTRVDSRYIPQSYLFSLQVFLTFCMSIVALLRLILQATTIEPKFLYGYQILTMLASFVIMWPISLILVFLERRRQLPSVPSRGHGLILLLFWTLAFASENLAFISWQNPEWWWIDRDSSKKQELGLWIVRYVSTALLFALAFKAPGVFNRQSTFDSDDDTEGLLPNDNSAEGIGRQDNQRSTFSNVWRKCKLMWPYIWPKKNIFLQILIVLCIILLAIGRVVNLYMPIYYKKIVDSLTISEDTVGDVRVLQVGELQFRWDLVLIYSGLRFLSGGGTGGMGLLNNTRTLLWVWVQQYTTRSIGVHLFGHLHGLSLKWHLSRKTGEVLRVMDRGTSSINQLLSYVLFQILPTIADIIVALVYFLITYDFYFALIIFITMALYLAVTIIITEWRTKYRRAMNLTDNEKNSKGVDSLLNFETVKYYGAETFEVGRYDNAIVDYQKAEFKSSASLCLLNTMQGVIINLGFLAGTMLCAYYVSKGKDDMTVGDFVLFATYILQLYMPLNFFGTYYRMIQQAFVDMENMFDLLSEKQEIVDVPNAQMLRVNRGMIEFNNVSFAYDERKPILKNVSFVVPPGQTFALVGPSGAGKSTIIRLLFRFYDVDDGTIKFDSQDISKVQQNSLRSTIGVVPQDTVLFNADIRYNIRYGRVTATDLEVENSARASDIHSKILTFPDTYDTKVGERGLKLSGGEKQRVAIARTILKAPNIVLLDEATSALDTQTERNIQASLSKVCENRTTIMVAHRLSTVVHADQILVLKEGVIVERGRHDDLLNKNGVYAEMWSQQSQAENEENGASGNSTESDKDK